MKSQIAVQRTIKALRVNAERYPFSLPLDNKFTEPLTDGLAEAVHQNVISHIGVNRLAQAFLEGSNLLDVFLDGFAAQVSSVADAKPFAPVTPFDPPQIGTSDRLRKTINALTELATPWWAEPMDPRVEQHTFVYFPKKYSSMAPDIIRAGTQAIEWEYENCAVLSLLKGCVPSELESALEQTTLRLQRNTRTWTEAIKLS